MTAGNSDQTLPIWQPATGEQQASVRLGTADDVNDAVQAAAGAFPAWSSTSLSRRAEILFEFRALVARERHTIAELVSAEHGKVTADALGEVSRGLENVEFACGIPHLLKGSYSEQASTGVDVYSIKQPLGVVAGITPFNFPAMVPMWMFANALACGNTFVLKPSEKDPSASMFLAQLWQEAGLPDGCFNVINGDKFAVDRILSHPDIAAVSFVGSTPVARHVYSTGTAQGKRVQALGGAKNHMLVLADADLELAADAAVSAAFGSAGERCMAVSVVVAVATIADQLVDAIADRIGRIAVGPAADPVSEMGPLISQDHRDRVASYVEGASAAGATVVVDGSNAASEPGFFLRPSLIDDVRPGMRVYDDEIFGPVLGIVRVRDYTEGLKLINSNEFGNGTAVFTRDGGAARQFQHDVLVGMVGINVPVPVPVSYYSFGGWKNSLFGDRHIYGPDGVDFYTRTKVVTSRWPAPSTSQIDLGFPQTR